MFSVPFICSSSGVATVSATVSGLAPGNCAVTTTDGGTTSGYSEIGNCVIAIRPDRKMMTEITPAKIGRSMKNLDRFTAISSAITFLVKKVATYLAATVWDTSCGCTGAPGRMC